MRLSYFIFSMILAFATPAVAGYIEMGASANFRSSAYGEHNSAMSLSYTASLSYYFWEMSAWEINYTTGYSKQESKAPGDMEATTLIEDNIEMTSLDLVLSFAGRQDPFRPYIKIGGGYLEKERYRKVDHDAKERISRQAGLVPSAGVGLALKLTQELSIRFGMEAWTSPLTNRKKDEPVTVDMAGRAGISWLF